MLTAMSRWLRCSKRRTQRRTEVKVHEPGDFDVILALHSHYVTWQHEWCSNCFFISECCNFGSIFFNVLCCAMLIGMYLEFYYQDTPAMWMLYEYLLVFG